MANQGKTPSWKTDVNRHPTKKWATAPAFSYDGDDWDGYDEFDNYAPVPKPTGFRQRGQASTSGPFGQRSFTSPESTNVAMPLPRDRAGSYEVGVERREPTSGPAHGQPLSLDTAGASTGYPAFPATTNSSRYPPADTHDPQGGPNADGIDASPSVYSSVTASSNAFSPHDYTSSAPPAQGVPPSFPSLQESDLSEERFPPRKSSRSQQINPAAQVLAELGTPAFRDQSQTRSLDGTSEISATEHAATPITFIRPADIYKRIEIEREKERLSSESSRASVDSSKDGMRRTSIPHLPSRSPMRQVTTSSDVAAAEAPLSDKDNHPSQELYLQYSSPPVLSPPEVVESTNSAAIEHPNLERSTAESQSIPPKLPDLTRFSGFGIGSDTWKSPVNSSVTQINTSVTSQDSSSELQHQPSLGFRSAVHQAFDQGNDRLAPLSASAYGSQRSIEGSEISGLGTNSTDGISPIMSQVPSGSIDTFTKSQLDSTPMQSAIAEEAEDASSSATRPDSTSTLRGPVLSSKNATPSHSRDVSTDSFMPGYRRQTTPPNTKYTPAGSAAIQEYHDVQDPVAAEVTQIPEAFSEPRGTNYETTTENDAVEMPGAAAAVESSNRYTDAVERDAAMSTSQRSSLSSWASSKHRSNSPQKVDDHNDHFQDAEVENIAEGVVPDPRAEPDLNSKDESAGTRAIEDFAIVSGAGTAATGAALGAITLMSQSNTAEEDAGPSSVLSSMPPPLPPKDTPMQNVSENAASYFPTSPSQADTDNSEHENESEKLRQDILASLAPKESTFQPGRPLSPLIPQQPASPTFQQTDNRTSALLPSEYDSYWAVNQDPNEIQSGNDNQTSSKALPAIHDEDMQAQDSEVPPPRQLADPTPSSGLHASGLDRRFSWEMDDEEDNLQPSQPPLIDQGARDIRTPTQNDGLQVMNAYASPSRIAELDSTQMQHVQLIEDDNLASFDKSQGTGEYSVSPDAHELADNNRGSVSSISNVRSPDYDGRTSIDQTDGFGPSPVQSSGPPIPPQSPSAQQSSTAGRRISQIKPAGFREIVALKNPQDRIKGYNHTREVFAETDTGLDNWLNFMKTQDPTIGDSFMKSGPLHSTGTSGPTSRQPYPHVRTPTTPGGSLESPQGPRRSLTSGGRSSSAQMSAKGKDLLHSAGVFSGKATHGAKGLFAKGKSKFRSASSSDKTQKRATDVPPMPHPLPTTHKQSTTPFMPAPATRVDAEQRDMPLYAPGPRFQKEQYNVPQSAITVTAQDEQIDRMKSATAPRISLDQLRTSSFQTQTLTIQNQDGSSPVDKTARPLAEDENIARTLSSPQSSQAKPMTYEPLQLPAFPNSPRESFSSAVSRQLDLEHPRPDTSELLTATPGSLDPLPLSSEQSTDIRSRGTEAPLVSATDSSAAMLAEVANNPELNDDSWELVETPEASEYDAKVATKENFETELPPHAMDNEAIVEASLGEGTPSLNVAQNSQEVQSNLLGAAISSPHETETAVVDTHSQARDFLASNQTQSAVQTHTLSKEPQSYILQSDDTVAAVDNSRDPYVGSPVPEHGHSAAALLPMQALNSALPQPSNRTSSMFIKGNENSPPHREKQLPPVPIMSDTIIDPIDPRRQGTEYQIPGVGPPPSSKPESPPKTRSWHRFLSRKGSSAGGKNKSKEPKNSRVMPEAAVHTEPASIGHRNMPSRDSGIQSTIPPDQWRTSSSFPHDARRASTLPATKSDDVRRSVTAPLNQPALSLKSRPASKAPTDRSDSPGKKKRLSGISLNSLFGSQYLASSYNPHAPPTYANRLSKPDPRTASFINAEPRGRRATIGTDVRRPTASSGSRPPSFHPLDHPDSKYFTQGLSQTGASARGSVDGYNRRSLDQSSSSAVRTSSAPAKGRWQPPLRSSFSDDKRRSHIEYLQSQEIFPVRPHSRSWDQYSQPAVDNEAKRPQQFRANSNDTAALPKSNGLGSEPSRITTRDANMVPFEQSKENWPPQQQSEHSEANPRSSYLQQHAPILLPYHYSPQSYNASAPQGASPPPLAQQQSTYTPRSQPPSASPAPPPVPDHAHIPLSARQQNNTSPVAAPNNFPPANTSPTQPRPRTAPAPAPARGYPPPKTSPPPSAVPAVPIASLPPSVRKSAGRVAQPTAPPPEAAGSPSKPLQASLGLPTQQAAQPQAPLQSQEQARESQLGQRQERPETQPGPPRSEQREEQPPPLPPPHNPTSPSASASASASASPSAPARAPTSNPATPNTPKSHPSPPSATQSSPFPPRHSSKNAPPTSIPLSTSTTARSAAALPPQLQLNTAFSRPEDFEDADVEAGEEEQESGVKEPAAAATEGSVVARADGRRERGDQGGEDEDNHNHNHNHNHNDDDDDDDDDEEVVMSPTSWPGQEWMPREFMAAGGGGGGGG